MLDPKNEEAIYLLALLKIKQSDYKKAKELDPYDEDAKNVNLQNKIPGQNLCEALQGMGTTFIKLGQFLATRPDIIGEEMAKDLEKLHSLKNVSGLIFSGGPSTVTKKIFPKIPKRIFLMNIPILGICYGLQLIAKQFGGQIKANSKSREYGRTEINKIKNSTITENFYNNGKNQVWMSHQDSVTKIPKSFSTIASSRNSKFAIIENVKKKIYGLQFHPEVSHTSKGSILLKNFVF